MKFLAKLKTGTPRRAMALVLAAAIAFGLLPTIGINAYASEGYSLQEAIEANGSAQVTLKLDSVANPKIVSEKNKAQGGWIASYTVEGTKGFGYCVNHDLPAPNNGAATTMTVQRSSTLESNTLLTNCYFLAYSEHRDGEDYHDNVLEWVRAEYPTADFSTTDWTVGLTDDEWRKASQIAIWACTNVASGPALSIEGQMGWNNGPQLIQDPNAYEYITMSKNSSASATRVLLAAKALYAHASFLTAHGYSFTSRTAAYTPTETGQC